MRDSRHRRRGASVPPTARRAAQRPIPPLRLLVALSLCFPSPGNCCGWPARCSPCQQQAGACVGLPACSGCRLAAAGSGSGSLHVQLAFLEAGGDVQADPVRHDGPQAGGGLAIHLVRGAGPASAKVGVVGGQAEVEGCGEARRAGHALHGRRLQAPTGTGWGRLSLAVLLVPSKWCSSLRAAHCCK